MSYSKEDCTKALKEVEDRIGKSPTMKDYQKTEISPSIDTILKHFDTWNDAKQEAGLNTYKQNNVEPKPEDVTIPDGKNWEDLSSYQRYYYKNQEKEKQRTKERTKELKKWFKEYKRKFECKRCGEDHPACLDFHHTGEKESGVNELVSRKNTSKKRIEEEVSKCEVLCANCHRKEHAQLEI